MKKLVSTLLTALLALALITGCSSQKSEVTGNHKIGVIQLVDHTSLNTIKDAFDDELKKLGYTEDNLEVDFKNAQGDINTCASIANEFEGEELECVMAIATPAAQAVAKLAVNTPVVFAAVSDPVGAELTSSLDAPDKNITGTCDEVQVDQIVDMALTVQPDIKTLGLLYNTGETNSVTNIKNVKAYCEKKGIKTVEATITSVNEAQSAVQALASKCDAIFTPNDNTVASAMSVIGSSCIEQKKAIYVGADSMVQDGGFMTVGIDYEELGRETARQVDAILKGKKAADIPVKIFKDDLNIYVNKNTAEKLGIELPESVTSNEKYIEL
ncbi:MAG: ABC transporter substrate-binding protein [Erysipelotrichaceae bacterium]|nr:ABC transporter substrate-binding protein [Erysipelotrichaceae bacterium]